MQHSEFIDNEQLDPLTEMALEWLVRLHSGEETEQDWQAYEVWRVATPAQTTAANAAEALWESIGAAIKRPKWSVVKTAATKLLLVFVLMSGVLAVGTHQNIITSPASLLADYRTTTGRAETVLLADGSQLQMDSATSVDVEFSDNKRQIILYAGQIHVDVASDKSRPFEVHAANVVIRALGTGFNVKRDAGNVGVTVTEHSVQISHDKTSFQLSSGEHISYNSHTGFSTLAVGDLRTLTAWRRGHLIFDNRPLYVVMEEMQRYSDSKIFFLDDNLKQLSVTGIFDTEDAEGLLKAVEHTLPIRVRQFPWVVVLDAKPESDSK